MVPQINYTCIGLYDNAPQLPWIQQPESSLAFIYFACATIGVAMLKHTLMALVDRSR